MCLAIPARVVSIEPDPTAPVAVVEHDGLLRRVQLLYLPDVRVGDYVLAQAGFAIRRLREDEARESLELTRTALARAAGEADT